VREGLVELALGEATGLEAGGPYFDDAVNGWVAGDVNAKVPGSESAVEIAERFRPVLDDLADRHRGEAVLVVSHGGAIVATLAVLAFEPGRPTSVPNCAAYVLERDVDGWRLGEATLSLG
jgi:broad specificity phosphatase PhoE